MNPLTGMIIVAVTLVIGSVIYLVVARLSPEGGRSDRTPTNVYAVTAGAMSLLIAFTMSMTYGEYQKAQEAVQMEADAVYSMNRAAEFMQPELRDQLRNQLVCYANSVIDDEWPLMEGGTTTWSEGVRATAAQMDTILMGDIQAAGPGLSLWQAANSSRLAAHQERMLLAGDGVPLILWLLLILGSAITIISLFVYADRSKPGWGHILVIIGPLFIAAAALVVIAFFDHPYSRAPGAIAPTAMEEVRYNMVTNRIGDAPLPSCPSTS